MDKKFTPPPVAVGDTVLHYTAGEKMPERASPAVVQSVHGNTVGLVVYRGMQRAYLDYCRHVDDPFLKEDSNKATRLRMGGWGYSSMLQRIADLEEALTKEPKSKAR